MACASMPSARFRRPFSRWPWRWAFLPWACDTARLHLWARVLGAPLTASQAFRAVLGSELGAAATPTAVGGIPVKVALLHDHGVPPATGVSLCAIKSFEDALFFALALPVAVGLTAAQTLPVLQALAARIPGAELALAAAVAAAVAGVVAAVAWRARGPGRVQRFVRTAADQARLAARAGPRRFAFSMSCTAVQWVARYSAITALAAGLGASLDPVRAWLLQWVVFTSMTLVPTPGAAGGAEAAFALAYGALLPPELMTWLVLGWRAVTFYLLVGVGALLFALLEMRRRRGRAPDPPAPASTPRPCPPRLAS
jgi:glycosyltransferase 2 family protein